MSELAQAMALLRAVKNADDDTQGKIDEFLEHMAEPIVKVVRDECPGNPREDWDNVGVMFCRHGRYNLGDKDADDPIEEITIYDLGGYEIEESRLDAVQEMLRDWMDVMQGRDGAKSDDYLRGEAAYRWVSQQSDEGFADERTEHRVSKDVALLRALYMHEHSGITISHGRFTDPFDSGQIGYHYITKAKLQEEFGGDEARAVACLEAELAVYDAYLRGDVWGYVITDREGNDIDSCYGFYSDDLESMLDHAEEEYHDALKEAWEDRQ